MSTHHPPRARVYHNHGRAPLLTIRCRDIQVLKTYGAAPYGNALKKLEQQIKEKQDSVNEKIGVKVRRKLPTPAPRREANNVS